MPLVDTSFLTIINKALRKLGQRALVIGELADPPVPNGKNARIVVESFAEILEQIIDDYPWGFAITRGQLDTPGVPVFGYSFSYPFPDGVLYSAIPYAVRILEIGDKQVWTWGAPGFWDGWYANTDFRWKSESREILLDLDEPLDIRYLYLPATAVNMPPNFREALSCRLAMEWAESMTATQTLDEKLERRYEKYTALAQSVDSAEGIPDPIKSSTWIDGRLT
jgi:hypothetical protein